MTEQKEFCPKCGSVDFGILRDMTSRRVCKCSHSWAAPEKKDISPHLLVHKELWNQVSERYDKLKSDYDALKAKLEKAEKVIKDCEEVTTIFIHGVMDFKGCHREVKLMDKLSDALLTMKQAREYLKGEG